MTVRVIILKVDRNKKVDYDMHHTLAQSNITNQTNIFSIDNVHKYKLLNLKCKLKISLIMISLPHPMLFTCNVQN